MLASSLVLLAATALLVEVKHHHHFLSDHFIERLNQANSSWTAGRK